MANNCFEVEMKTRLTSINITGIGPTKLNYEKKYCQQTFKDKLSFVSIVLFRWGYCLSGTDYVGGCTFSTEHFWEK